MIAATLLIPLIGLALFIALTQLRAAVMGKALPGCGPKSGCDEVTSGRWSRIGPFPVVFPGVAVYFAFSISAVLAHPQFPISGLRHLGFPRDTSILVMQSLFFCAVLSAGAAVWFLTLQAIVIRRFCLYCTLAHLSALGASLMAFNCAKPVESVFFTALVFLGTFIAGQIILTPKLYSASLPIPADNDIVSNDADAPVSDGNVVAECRPVPAGGDTGGTSGADAPVGDGNVVAACQPISAGEDAGGAALPTVAENRRVTVMEGKISLSVRLWPIMGSPLAKRILIDMMDFTCKHCRKLHAILKERISQNPGEWAALIMPVPMETQCNPTMKTTPKEHIGACEYTQLAMAVFHGKPEAFEEFDRWLCEGETPPGLDAVKARATEILGQESLARAMEDSRQTKRLNEAIAIYDAVGQGQIPKLLLEKQLISGPILNLSQLDQILANEIRLLEGK
jgi:uncharacterized membrane protein